MSDHSRTTPRRCRVEWPTADPKLDMLDAMKENPKTNTPAQVSAKSKSIIEEELAKCFVSAPLCEDNAVVAIVYRKEAFQNWKAVLVNLYWRARRQSAIWDCFTQLVAMDLMDITALEAPLTVYRSVSDNAEQVTNLLYCFKYPSDDSGRSYDGNLGVQNVDWHLDLKWLAIMIVRGGRNLHEIFDKLVQMAYLGPTIQERMTWATASHDGKIWKIENNKMDSIPAMDNDTYNRANHTFGFILPHGLNALSGATRQAKYAEASRGFLRRFNEIEAAYKSEFNLDPDQLSLEHEQAQYFEDNPDKITGCRYSPLQ